MVEFNCYSRGNYYHFDCNRNRIPDTRLFNYRTGFYLDSGTFKVESFFIQKAAGQDKVVCDERDNLIIKELRLCLYIILVGFFCIMLFVISYHRTRNSVPTITLPLIAFGGAVFMKLYVQLLSWFSTAGEKKEKNYEQVTEICMV